MSFLWKKLINFIYEEDYSLLEHDKPVDWLEKSYRVAEKPPKRGIITYLSTDAVIIDHNLCFHPKFLDKQVYEVHEGCEVEIHYLREEIDKVLVITNEDEYYECSNSENIFGMVCERNGKVFKIDSQDREYSLDEVSASFNPITGDWVKIEIFSDLSKKPSLTPLRSSKLSGQIKGLQKRSGLIENNIWFNFDACESGFIPMEGDHVVAEVIESTQGQCIWRALSVCQNFFNQPKKSQLKNIWSESMSSLIEISGNFNFGEVARGEFKTTQLTIKNFQLESCQMTNIQFRKNSQLSVDAVFPIFLCPGEEIKVSVKCTGRYLGISSEGGVFYFEPGGQTRRMFDVNVGISSVPDVPVSSSSGFQRKAIRPVSNPNEVYTVGERKCPRDRFAHRPGCYQMPKALQELLKGCDFYDDLMVEAVADKILNWAPYFNSEVTFDFYKQFFHTLLFLEEHFDQWTLDQFSMTRVFMKRCGGELLELEVPGLEENRPSLCIGDTVIVRQPWKNEDPPTAHTGFIHQITQQFLKISFNSEFYRTYEMTDCNVTFRAGPGTFPHEHDAINRAYLKLGPAFLFPESVDEKPPQVLKEDSGFWYNTDLNAEQKEAVRHILRGVCRPLPYIIFGPPGTGKTMTVVEAVLQVIRRVPGSRVLVAAPSNSSADLLTQRLVKIGKLQVGEIVRIMAFSRSEELFPDDIIDYIFVPDDAERQERVSNNIGRHLITVGTCLSLSCMHLRNLPKGIFTHIFLDEAGYATESKAMVPITLLDPKFGQVILAGDPLQLGPVVMSKIAKNFGLEKSFLFRLMSRLPYTADSINFPDTLGFDPRLVTHLVKNYRSVPEILKLPSLLFYEDNLEPMIHGLSGREFEIFTEFCRKMNESAPHRTFILHGVRGVNIQEADSPSWMNPQEIKQIYLYLKNLYEIGVKEQEVGIITPYRKQASKIRELLRTLEMPLPKIGTVEEFQGQERQVILLSCVRSNNSLKKTRFSGLGFLVDNRRLNVAITRARALLIIIANPHILAEDAYWRNVVQYATNIGGYVGCDLPESYQDI